MKQIFEVPENCNVQIEHIGRTIVTTFVEKEVELKDLDCYKMDCDGIPTFVIARRNIQESYYVLISNIIHKGGSHGWNKEFINRIKITRQEMQSELSKHGKVFDFENKVLKELRCMAKLNEKYYCMDDFFEPNSCVESMSGISNKRFEIGNYFRTKQECQEFCNKVKQLLNGKETNTTT